MHVSTRAGHAPFSYQNLFIVIGFVFLMVGVGGTFVPLSTVSFGAGPINASVGGISAFSALTTFVGIVLIVLGMVFPSGRRRLRR